MSNKKATKRALLTSILAICLCMVMLIGSTFAWFTDTASTNVNSIQSGTLDVGLQYAKAWDNGNPIEWADVDKDTKLTFRTADGRAADKIFWEPGCTYVLPELKVVNNGNLARKYKIIINGIQGDAELNQVIDWTMTTDDGIAALGSEHHLAVAAEGAKSADILTIKGHMQETAGNTYMGMTIEGITITVVATQDTVEADSFGTDYDALANGNPDHITEWNEAALTASVPAPTDGEATLTAGRVTVTVPAGAVAENYTGDLNLVVKEIQAPADVTDGKIALAYDVTLEGVKPADENTTEMTVKIDNLPKNLNNVSIYWNNNDTLVDMNATYDPATGVATFKTIHFSEYVLTYDGSVKVTSMDDLAAKRGNDDWWRGVYSGSYKLMDDITVNKCLFFSDGVDVDLNGHTLTFTSSYWSEYSNVAETNVKFHNGTIVINNRSAYIWNASKNTVNLDFTNVTVDATNAAAAFRTQPYLQEHYLNITGGIFTTSGKFLSADPTYSADASTPSKSNITVKGANVTTTNANAVHLYATYDNAVIVASFTDCVFDCSNSSSNYPIYVGVDAAKGSSIDLTMTNCSLLAKNGGALTNYIFNANKEGLTLTLNNCTGNNGVALTK